MIQPVPAAASSVVPDDMIHGRTDGRVDRTTTGRCALPSVFLFHHAHVKSIDPSIVVAVVVDPAGDVRYVRTYSNVTLARFSLQRGLLVTMETRFWSHMHVLNGSL